MAVMSADALVKIALRGELTESHAEQLASQDPEVITLVLLAASERIGKQGARIAELEAGLAAAGASQAQQPSPSTQSDISTPSGMVPVYAKPNKSKRRKRPGAREGHPGRRRETPTRIDRRKSHRLKSCPCCGGRLQRCRRSRTRVIEDIPEDIQPVVTEHTIQRDFCPKCKKHVEPVVSDAMPGAMLGHRVIALTGWFHYGLGITIDHIVELLAGHLQTRLTPGGLVDAWRRLAEVLEGWYEQIGEQARSSARLHADETGWRVEGQTHWLWCFANDDNCYYMIDRCRGSPALRKFFTDEFEGVLITDFWAPYESVCAEDRQYCLVHLLRELAKVDLRNDGDEWRAFAKKLRRLLRDGIRLRKRADFVPGKYQNRVNRLNTRLARLANEESAGDDQRANDESAEPANGIPPDNDVRRLKKRLRKYVEYIFTFLDYANVPFENNFAERQIRPAVILRKNSQSNRSQRGAATQAVLMSICRTLKLRGHDPSKTVAAALKSYIQTGQLPPIPPPTVANC